MIIKAKVKPNSPKFEIIDKGEYFQINVTSEPEKGKANLEIVKELSKIYGKCKIIRGLKSRNKIIEIIEK